MYYLEVELTAQRSPEKTESTKFSWVDRILLEE